MLVSQVKIFAKFQNFHEKILSLKRVKYQAKLLKFAGKMQSLLELFEDNKFNPLKFFFSPIRANFISKDAEFFTDAQIQS